MKKQGFQKKLSLAILMAFISLFAAVAEVQAHCDPWNIMNYGPYCRSLWTGSCSQCCADHNSNVWWYCNNYCQDENELTACFDHGGQVYDNCLNGCETLPWDTGASAPPACSTGG